MAVYNWKLASVYRYEMRNSDSIAIPRFRGDVPTLFIAECVLVYMQARQHMPSKMPIVTMSMT